MNKSTKTLILTALVSLGLSKNTFTQEASFITKAKGYGGEMKLLIKVDGTKINDIEILNHKESSPVMSRAFPLIKERIIKAQSPIVDSISGATYTSTAVKRAVADVFKKNLNKDFGRVNFKTSAPEQPIAYLAPVTTDLVIIGGGPAGLAAAIAAKESGLKNIILIKKLDILSGNGKFDMNFFDLINSEAQKKSGNEITIENFIESKSKSSDSKERIKAHAEGSSKLDKWLRAMKINLNYSYTGTSHMAEKDAYAGECIQDGLEAKVKELGIDVRTGTSGVDLIIENGVAKGVKVKQKNNFYDINAKAVIVATGGFSANKELLEKYTKGTKNHGAEKIETSNQMSATGDLIPVFEKNGLAMDNMEVLSIFQFIISKSRDLTGGGDGYILINSDGNRFMNERISNGNSMEFAKNILKQKTFYVYDENLYNSFYRFQKHAKAGLHMKADTLEELAKKLNVPAKNLSETITEFNKAVRGEISDPYREKAFTREFRTQGPFYAVQVESAIHMTKGGVVANQNTEVLNKEEKIVKGLYAAGEVTSTSGAYNSAVVFGKLAGEQAANFIENK